MKAEPKTILRFLLEHYQLDSIGWGTPFLLVPEATNVDELTIQKLIKAKEKDLYLSSISPLGVPFNNLKGSSKEIQRLKFIEKGRPGSACPKKFLSLNKEFTEEAICTASRQYQSLKLESLKDQLSLQEYKKQSEDIMQSTCLCVGLGTTALIVNEIERKTEGNEVLICPGPNMAYFSKKVSLKQMIGHIYGRESIIERTDRPHMFVKELGLYVNYLKNKLENMDGEVSQKERVNQRKFVENLKSGITYYNELFYSEHNYFSQMNENITEALDQFWMEMILIEEMLAAPELATAEVH